MPVFSREHIFLKFYYDCPLSSHKRHKIRIYARSAWKRTPNFVPVRHEIGPLLRRTGICSGGGLCPEISLTCELAASEAQTRHSGCENNGGEDSGDSGCEDESRESEAVVRPPPYAEVAEEFSTLEAKARSSGMEDVSFHLEKARMAWIRAHASSKKGQQQDIRSFFDTWG